MRASWVGVQWYLIAFMFYRGNSTELQLSGGRMESYKVVLAKDMK